MTVTLDEPRRSGRSTKGQHTKNDLLEPSTSSKRKGARSSSSAASKKRSSQEPTPTSDLPSASATPEPGHDTAAAGNADAMGGEASENEGNGGGDDEEIIRCICGEYEEEEDIERDMICCDKCSAWQHNDCMGLNFPKGQEPEQYFCEKCRPENHRELLAKIERGERPWEEVARLRTARIAELKKKKKGKKGGRKSAGSGNGGGRASSQKSSAANEGSPDSGNGNAVVKREGSAASTSVKAVTPVASSASAKAASPVVPVQYDGQGQGSGSHRKRKSEHVDSGVNGPAVKVQKQEMSPPMAATSPTTATPATTAGFPPGMPMPMPPQQHIPIPAPRVQQQPVQPPHLTPAPAPFQPQHPQQVLPPQPIVPTMPQGQYYVQAPEQQQQFQQYQPVQQPQPHQQPQPPFEQQQQQQQQQPAVPQEPAAPPPPPTQEELLNSLSPARRNVANALAKLFADSIPASIKSGAFLLPPTLTIPQAGTTVALAVEFAMYKNLCNGVGEIKDNYKQQMRTILFNVKRNPALRDGVLSGAITADRLSTMSTKDMASKEQRQREDEIKREAEKQHMIVKEEGPRIRRTHKGEEIIEDETQPVVNESIFSNAPRRGTVTSMQSGDSDKDREKGHVSPRRVSPTPEPGARQGSEQPGHGNNRDNDDWHRPHSPGVDHEQRFAAPPDQDGPFPFPHDQPPVTRAEADAEIDALLGDDDNNEEPYSPPYSPKPFIYDSDTAVRGLNAVVWAGTLSMASFTQFHCEAKHVGGADLSERISWSELMPPVLVIDGRIDVKLATAYLCGLRFSQTTDVCVTAITAPTQSRERVEFDRIFEYFAQRNRYGVIGKHANALVKDTYVVPVEKQDGVFSAGDSAAARRPEFLDLLENNSVEEPITDRLLLVVFVVRNGETSVANTPAAAGQTSAITASANTTQTPSLREQQTDGAGPSSAHVRQTSEGQGVPTSQSRSQSQSQPPPQPQVQTQQQTPTPATGQPSTVTTGPPNPAVPANNTASTTASTPTYQQPVPATTHTYNVVMPAPRPTPPVAALNPLHAQIFGQYATSPAVTELLTRAPQADETQLRNVAAMIASNPVAASDYLLLAQMIVGGGRIGGGNAGQ